MDPSTSSISQPITADSLQDVEQRGTPEQGSLAKASLYVTNLDASVTEANLNALFSEHGEVLAVKICRDHRTGFSRGYGYVNYSSLHHAMKVMKLLNFKPLKGKQIRVMLSNRDSTLTSGGATVFFKDFGRGLEIGDLNELFSSFGPIITSELAMDSDGDSKGYGYVIYSHKEAAETAVDIMDNMVYHSHCVRVVPFLCKEDRDREKPKLQNYPTLYAENMTSIVSSEEVELVFSNYGHVVHSHVLQDYEGYPTGSGFIVFEKIDDAIKAIKGLNGKRPPKDKKVDPIYFKEHSVWYVRWANSMFKSTDRPLTRPEKERSGIPKKMEGVDLYIKNFDDDMTEMKLKQLFSDFGMILYSKVMLDSRRLSRGYGFVGFVTPEDAAKAMNAMHGKIIGRRSLHVSVARRRKERNANLEAVREQYDRGTKCTQLAPVVPILFVPWYKIIRQEEREPEEKEREATKLSDSEFGDHPSYYLHHDAQAVVSASA